MRTALVFSLLLAGCGGSDSEVCDRGFAKVEECGGQVEVQGGGDVDCSGQVECLMGCVNDATCDEIKNPDGTPYDACVDACAE